MITESEAIVMAIDKRIERMKNIIATNPSHMRKGMLLAYEDIREYIRNRQERSGELS